MTEEQIRACKAAYARQWRRDHPEQARAIQERYWARKAEKEVIRKAEARCLPCSCGCRPEIILAGDRYQVICRSCGRTVSPVLDADDAVRLWDLMRGSSIEMEYAVPGMAYETR